VKIVLRTGSTKCFTVPAAMVCPEGAACNPPPPREVPCPE
jgi:hypothetical protein